MSTLLERAQQLVDGAAHLRDWLGSGGKVVDVDLAQKRANICITCPQNKQKTLLEIVGIHVKNQLQLKNHLQLRVDGEKKLHVCDVCDCVLKLKIWREIEKIAPTPEERPKYPEFCWLVNEVPESHL